MAPKFLIFGTDPRGYQSSAKKKTLKNSRDYKKLSESSKYK